MTKNLILLLLLSFGSAALAATHTVTTAVDENGSGPDLSLREALLNAADGDTINFDASLNGKTIYLQHGTLFFSRSIAIDASSLSRGVYISGGGQDNVFYFSAPINPAVVSLKRLGIVDGNAGAGLNGGGLLLGSYTDGGSRLTITLEECHIARNRTSTANAGGSAIAIVGNVDVTLDRCSLIENSGMNASVIYVDERVPLPVKINSCTIACNDPGESANLRGGTLMNTFGAAFHVTHTTITQNLVKNGGGILFGNANFSHCIVAGNIGGKSVKGSVTSNGYNIFGEDTPSYATGTDILTDDPELLDPMRRGGFTYTCAFRPGSPACDAGDPSIIVPLGFTDQRGFSRFRDGDGDFFGSTTIDIGAFELGETIVVDTYVDEEFTLPDNGTSLREAIVIAASIGDGSRITISDTLLVNLGKFELALGELAPISTIWIDYPGWRILRNGIAGRQNIHSNSGRVFSIDDPATVTLEGFNLSGGVSGEGGAIRVGLDGVVNLDDSVIDSSSATRGGGIYAEGDVYLTRSIVTRCIGLESSGGAGDALGGGLYVTGRLKAVNSIILTNEVQGRAGGIWASGETFLTHCTVYDNSASSVNTGVGLTQVGGRAELSYSVFAKNAFQATVNNFFGTVISRAINAEDGGQLTGGNDLLWTDPKLEQVELDGLRPMAFESPLIDRGEESSCLRMDQHGNPRILKGSLNSPAVSPARADLGAMESLETFYVTTAEDQNTGAVDDGVSLREAIALSNNSNNEPGTVITFSSTLNGQKIQLRRDRGGSLRIAKTVSIKGPEQSAYAIEISGAYDPGRAVTSDDFRVFHIESSNNELQIVNLENLTISRGASLGNGGGVLDTGNNNSRLKMKGVIVKECRAVNGGGVAVGNFADLECEQCSFFHNFASNGGGAIFRMQDNGTSECLDCSHCTFYENEADRGGAIFIEEGGSYLEGGGELFRCTLARNRANSGGGGLWIKLIDSPLGNQAGLYRLNHSLVVENSPQDIEMAGPLWRVPFFNNVVGNDPSMNGSNLVTANAGIGRFGDHGGGTPTVSLLATSPAVDFAGAGSEPGQRGVQVNDGDGDGNADLDAGAYELVRPVIVVNTIADENGVPGDPGTSLREALSIAGHGSVIQFDSSLDGETIILTQPLQVAENQLIEIDGTTLFSGITISGGGQVENLLDVWGYAALKGLQFKRSTKTAVRVGGPFGFAHARIEGCYFDECGDVSNLSQPIIAFSGAVDVLGGARAELVDSSFFNSTGTLSGALFCAGLMDVSQCTFAGNIGTEAGVIWNQGCTDFSFCTFVENVARPLSGVPEGPASGEVAFGDQPPNVATVEIRFSACVFDEDTSERLLSVVPGNAARIISEGFNVARANEPLLNATTDQINIDPELDQLMVNGFVPFYPPKRFSPLVDAVAGSLPGIPRFDMRGSIRSLDGNGDTIPLADAGAAENRSMILVDTAQDEDDGIGSGSGTSLRDAVAALQTWPIPESPVIGFDPALAGQEIFLQSFLGGELLISNSVDIDASNLSSNVTVVGDGVAGGFRVFQFNASGQLIQMRGVNVRNGSVLGDGAGIWVTNNTQAQLDECEVFENFASGHGGGIAVTGGSFLGLNDSTVAMNHADGFGGGLFVSDSFVGMLQSTLAQNHSVSGGGAIADLLLSDVDIQHCTIVDNTADAGGGGIDIVHVARAFHTILAQNQPFNFHNRAGTASFTSLGYNLDDGTTGVFNQASDLTDISDAELGSLTLLGGKTRVIPLELCSPAVDSGDPILAPIAGIYDQTRVTPRVLDGDYLGSSIVDRGAFELDTLNLPDDLDGDGMPNFYEIQNGFNPKDSADGGADSDKDGLLNKLEFIAGTDPRDATSNLRVVSFRNLNPDQTFFEIVWTSNDSIPDLVYDIYISTDLKMWTPVTTGISATQLSPTTTRIFEVLQNPRKDKLFVRIGARRSIPL